MLVLIVDDEEGIRMLYARELMDEGYDVITIPDGEGLLAVIATEKPDCVILDIKMRDYDGLDLLIKIKEEFFYLPVILNSAYSSFKFDTKVKFADAYVVKSSWLDELKSELSRLCPLPDSEQASYRIFRRLSKAFLNKLDQGGFVGLSVSPNVSDDFSAFRLVLSERMDTLFDGHSFNRTEAKQIFNMAKTTFEAEKHFARTMLAQRLHALRGFYGQPFPALRRNCSRSAGLFLEETYTCGRYEIMEFPTYWNVMQQVLSDNRFTITVSNHAFYMAKMLGAWQVDGDETGGRVSFRLFFPLGSDPEIVAVKVAGDFQHFTTDIQNWDFQNGFDLQEHYSSMTGSFWEYTSADKIPAGFYQYKYQISFTDGSNRMFNVSENGNREGTFLVESWLR